MFNQACMKSFIWVNKRDQPLTFLDDMGFILGWTDLLKWIFSISVDYFSFHYWQICVKREQGIWSSQIQTKVVIIPWRGKKKRKEGAERESRCLADTSPGTFCSVTGLLLLYSPCSYSGCWATLMTKSFHKVSARLPPSSGCSSASTRGTTEHHQSCHVDKAVTHISIKQKGTAHVQALEIRF